MYQVIASAGNRTFKLWKSLLLRKYREKEKAYLIEGGNLLRDAYRSGTEVRALIFCGDLTPEERDDLLGPELAACVRECRTPLYGLAEDLFGELTQTENGRAFLACVSMPERSLADLGEKRDPARRASVLVLDRVQDPGNLGTLIRTADAAGFAGVILLKGTADPFAPKVVRAAAGSLLRLPLVTVAGPQELLAAARSLKLTTVATGLANAVPYTEAELGQGIALIVGNEGRGVAEELLREADLTVTIPMTGGIDSLNVSIAAAVLMFESLRQEEQNKRN